MKRRKSMKKLGKRYEEAKVYEERERLPVGGYVLEIQNVRYEDNSDKDYGDVIVLAFDIVEGDLKGFFSNDYENQTQEDKKWRGTYRLYVPQEDGSEKDEWTMRRFKTVISNFEESNSKYHWDWDENTLKGKKIGALFNNKEYNFEGRQGFFTNCHSLVPVEKIRSGKFKIPEDTLLNKSSTTNRPTNTSTNDGFINVPEGSPEEIPF
jgi:hypothetical protein